MNYVLNNRKDIPSNIIETSRQRQRQDQVEIGRIISLSEQLRGYIPAEVKSLFEEKLQVVQSLIKS